MDLAERNAKPTTCLRILETMNASFFLFFLKHHCRSENVCWLREVKENQGLLDINLPLRFTLLVSSIACTISPVLIASQSQRATFYQRVTNLTSLCNSLSSWHLTLALLSHAHLDIHHETPSSLDETTLPAIRTSPLRSICCISGCCRRHPSI